MKTEKTHVFAGHIVNCRDIDSGDQFNLEVLINVNHSQDEQENKAVDAARKKEVVQLSGNTFEFEYIQPSGKRVQQIITKETTELTPANEEAEQLLRQVDFA